MSKSNHQSETSELAWYCVQAQPKREHIAAAMLLKATDEVEVFCPRLRFRKVTRTGPKWFVEALFPGYLFVRCALAPHKRLVQGSQGVSRFLSFGELIPTIPDDFIRALQTQADEGETLHAENELKVGDEVVVTGGDFVGLQTTITRIADGKQRAHVLMDFLGQTCEAEVNLERLQSTRQPRQSIIS